MQLGTRLTGMALAGLAAAAMIGGSAAAAAEPAAPASETVTTTAAQPELLGGAVRDWCDHRIDYNGAPVYSAADTGSTKTGTFDSGDTVKALCGSEDQVSGKRYSACGGSGTTYLHYTTKPSWSPSQQHRYVPMSCFINN